MMKFLDGLATYTYFVPQTSCHDFMYAQLTAMSKIKWVVSSDEYMRILHLTN